MARFVCTVGAGLAASFIRFQQGLHLFGSMHPSATCPARVQLPSFQPPVICLRGCQCRRRFFFSDSQIRRRDIEASGEAWLGELVGKSVEFSVQIVRTEVPKATRCHIDSRNCLVIRCRGTYCGWLLRVAFASAFCGCFLRVVVE
jgi:hypothetical protein